MASALDISRPTPNLAGPARRRPGASGLPVLLADGSQWLLAVPQYRSTGASLTIPNVDRELAGLFDGSALSGEVALTDVWSAARTLLLANYDLTDDEISELVCLDSDDETSFVTSVIEAVFGSGSCARTYPNWVRASLLANGILPATLGPHDLANVLTILVATKRTIPASQFIDASRAAEEQSDLESLV